MSDSPQLSSTLEDYLEAILALSEVGGDARVRDISERLSVHKSTVTAALKTLSEKGLVDHEPYGAVVLTDAGRLIAVRVARSHAVVKSFLQEVLLVDAATAEEKPVQHPLLDDVLATFGGTVVGNDKDDPWED